VRVVFETRQGEKGVEAYDVAPVAAATVS
jgi:hypothetical protein